MARGNPPLRLLDYAAVRSRLSDGRSHLLLGNGFSIACDPVFSYPSLYDKAVAAGLSGRAQEVFSRLGTNNFEGVLRLLTDSHWVAQTYGLIPGPRSPMLADLDVVKSGLVQAIADSHLEHTGLVADRKKQAAAEFLAPYHNIFTTNYDLLIYWVIMHGEGRPIYWDGFGDDASEPDAPYVVFSFHLGEHKGVFYLHGGLHMYVNAGQVCKHCWSRTGEPLTSLIKGGFANGQYPLFVAEGSPNKKLEQILRSAYLSYGLDKLKRITNRLVIFGHSLGDNDDHLRRAIAGIRKLKDLYVGIHDERPNGVARFRNAVTAIQATRQQQELPPLDVKYYRSRTANVWDTAV